MSDWQVGDLALCVRADWEASPQLLRAGATYVVSRVEVGRNVPYALWIIGVALPDRWHGFRCDRFVKITPKAPDAFDLSVIEQMTGAPVEVVG